MISRSFEVGKRSSWLPVLACAGVVALVVGAHLARLLDPEPPRAGTLSAGDLNQYYFPAFVFVRNALLSGQLPLWNPYQMAGVPFVGLHVTMPMYPLLLIFLPLPPALAIAAHGLLHIGLCCLFTWLLARRIGLDAVGAGVATLVYGLSFQLAMALFSTANLTNMAWLPALLWALHRLAAKPRIPAALVFSAVLAMSFLSGFAQGFLYSLQVAALYALFLLATPITRDRRAQFVGLALLGGIVALGLIAAQLFPALELTSRSARGEGGLSFEHAAAFGQTTETMLRSLTGGSEGWIQLPRLVLPLAGLALLLRKHRLHALFFAALLLLLWDFLRGEYGWIYHYYYQLPGGNLFRIPARAAYVYVLAAAMLMGIGASQLTALLVERRPVWLAVGIALVVAVAVDQYSRSDVAIRYDPLVAPEEMMGPKALVSFARSQAGYDRIFVERWLNDRVPRKLGALNGIFVVPGYEPLLPGRYAEFLDLDELWHGQLAMTQPKPRRGGTRPPRRRYSGAPESMDLFSVRYYVDARRYGWPAKKRRPLQDLPALVEGVEVLRKPVPIYRRDRALPRAYVVHDVIHVPGRSEQLERLRASAGFDPHTQVVLAELASPAPLRPRAKEFARIEAYSLNQVELSVRCETDCVVVLTDLLDPGWTARVDGQPAPILRANYLFRALFLEAGDHRVAFRYHPIWFYVGAAVTVLTLFTIAAYGMRTRFRGVADEFASD